MVYCSGPLKLIFPPLGLHDKPHKSSHGHALTITRGLRLKSGQHNNVTCFGKIRLNAAPKNIFLILPAESMMPEDRILQV